MQHVCVGIDVARVIVAVRGREVVVRRRGVELIEAEVMITAQGEAPTPR